MNVKNLLLLAIGCLLFHALKVVVGQTSLTPAATSSSSLRHRRQQARATATEQPAWRSHDGKLFYGNDVFHLKGVNWNGIESDCRVVHGLWANSLDFYMDILETHRFNAIRLPISYEVMGRPELPVDQGCVSQEPEAWDMNAHTFLRHLMDTFHRRGMFVLLDLHSIEGQITELPWTASVSEDQVVDAWVMFARTFAMHPAVMGLEIKNEPHGPCSTADFHRHAARVITAILEAVPSFRGTFFIDGTSESMVDPAHAKDDDDDSGEGGGEGGEGGGGSKAPPWGGTFEMIARKCEEDALCRLGLDDRLVFAPHVYGPDVRGPPASCEDWVVFDRRFGFLQKHPFFNQSAIVATEFGGKMLEGSPDSAYFESWQGYMDHANLTAGAFFWTLPPTSDDTGGFIMNDWRSVDVHKARFLDLLQPSPSFFPLP